jgi:hypothetical protein
MDYSFPHYLLSKQTVDDRALNKDVVNMLHVHLPPEPVAIIEVGAGIGTMLKRLVEWNVFAPASMCWWMKWVRTSPTRGIGSRNGPWQQD